MTDQHPITPPPEQVRKWEIFTETPEGVKFWVPLREEPSTGEAEVPVSGEPPEASPRAIQINGKIRQREAWYLQTKCEPNSTEKEPAASSWETAKILASILDRIEALERTTSPGELRRGITNVVSMLWPSVDSTVILPTDPRLISSNDRSHPPTNHADGR